MGVIAAFLHYTAILVFLLRGTSAKDLRGAVSFLSEPEATRRAEEIMDDYNRMKLIFAEESFTVKDLDRDLKNGEGIVLGENEAGDEIWVYLPIDDDETPYAGPADVEISRKDGEAKVYLSDEDVKINVQGDFYKVKGTFYDELDEESGDYKLEMHYGISLGLKGDADLKMNPENSTEAILKGTLGAQLFADLPKFKKEHPQLKIIVMTDVPGSSADRFNTLTGVRLRRLGLNTKILKDSQIHSGGVDLYASGVRRFAERGATVGVHSWCCDEHGREAWEVPRGDPEHAPYVNYLAQMLGDTKGPAFYYYTINAAKAGDIHKMPWVQMRHFGLVTDEITGVR